MDSQQCHHDISIHCWCLSHFCPSPPKDVAILFHFHHPFHHYQLTFKVYHYQQGCTNIFNLKMKEHFLLVACCSTNQHLFKYQGIFFWLNIYLLPLVVFFLHTTMLLNAFKFLVVVDKCWHKWNIYIILEQDHDSPFKLLRLLSIQWR